MYIYTIIHTNIIINNNNQRRPLTSKSMPPTMNTQILYIYFLPTLVKYTYVQALGGSAYIAVHWCLRLPWHARTWCSVRRRYKVHES